MAICRICNVETTDASVQTCTGNNEVKYPDGTTLATLPFDPRKLHLPDWHRCPDCNVMPGGRHHWNCDQEHCPKCGGQLISCDCFEAEGTK